MPSGLAGEAVLDEPGERIEERLEVRLADERGAVAVVVQHRRHHGASTGRATPFIQTPCVLGCWPVMIVERDGMHTTDCG